MSEDMIQKADNQIQAGIDRQQEIYIMIDILKLILDTQVSLDEAEFILNYLDNWRVEKFERWNSK